MDSEKLIVELNFRNLIVDETREGESFNSQRMFDLLNESMVDKRTLSLIEIHELFKALDHTRTLAGSARLFHSLVNPSESIELIHAKQDSFCEVESNTRLRQTLEEYLKDFHQGETDLFRLLNANMLPINPYKAFKKAMSSIIKMVDGAEKVPRPETVYLDSLIQSILSFRASPVYALVRGPRFRTFAGIKTRKELGWFQPRLRFRPGRISGGGLWPFFPSLYFGSAWIFGFLRQIVAESFFLLTSWIGILGIFYAAVIKPIFDYETAILPIRDRIINSNRFASAVEAVAAIDELISFVAYSHKVEHTTVMPEITNHPVHSFVARDLKNPVMAAGSGAVIGNDVNLDGVRVTFITGPNSGGKTTYSKTIVQTQIMAQIGAPVVASFAKINMADRITYQAPAFDSLNDPEGRFGTELKVTRDVFFSVSPKSLTVLDEIAEGTTTQEKMSLSAEIMEGFHTIGNNTVLVTHSHELVEKFRERGTGQYIQVEFAGDLPTHKMIEGISKDSHALRVATKIGFAPEDIRNYLTEKGYLRKTAG